MSSTSARALRLTLPPVNTYVLPRLVALVMRATATGDAQTVSDLRDLLDLSDLD